jgi:hypothetical protein
VATCEIEYLSSPALGRLSLCLYSILQTCCHVETCTAACGDALSVVLYVGACECAIMLYQKLVVLALLAFPLKMIVTTNSNSTHSKKSNSKLAVHGTNLKFM